MKNGYHEYDLFLQGKQHTISLVEPNKEQGLKKILHYKIF